MAFCPQCGAAVEGRFCQKCGAAVDPGAAGTSGPQASSYVPPPHGNTIDASGIPANIASALCYILPIICPIVFLVAEPFKRDRKIRFDAFQSIFLTVFFIVAQIVLSIMWSISFNIGFLFAQLVHLAELILVIFLAFKAFQNQKVVLPMIGDLAEKQV